MPEFARTRLGIPINGEKALVGGLKSLRLVSERARLWPPARLAGMSHGLLGMKRGPDEPEGGVYGMNKKRVEENKNLRLPMYNFLI